MNCAACGGPSVIVNASRAQGGPYKVCVNPVCGVTWIDDAHFSARKALWERVYAEKVQENEWRMSRFPTRYADRT